MTPKDKIKNEIKLTPKKKLSIKSQVKQEKKDAKAKEKAAKKAAKAAEKESRKAQKEVAKSGGKPEKKIQEPKPVKQAVKPPTKEYKPGKPSKIKKTKPEIYPEQEKRDKKAKKEHPKKPPRKPKHKPTGELVHKDSDHGEEEVYPPMRIRKSLQLFLIAVIAWLIILIVGRGFFGWWVF